MKKIYFAGAIRGGRNKQTQYRHVIEGLKDSGYTVLTEHVGALDVVDTEKAMLTDEQIHDRDMEWIREADVIIADVSLPSLGVGYEIAYALHKLVKPVFCFCESMDSTHVSAMIRGILPVEIYMTPDDYLRRVLQTLLKHHVNGTKKDE